MKLTDTTLLDILLHSTGPGGVFAPAGTFVGLARDIEDKGQQTSMADVTEATGDVATRVPIAAWGSPHKIADGRWALDGPVCEFQPADATESQVVTYWFYASALTGGNLIGFQSLGDGVNLPDETHVFGLVPRLCIDPNGDVDASVILD